MPRKRAYKMNRKERVQQPTLGHTYAWETEKGGQVGDRGQVATERGRVRKASLQRQAVDGPRGMVQKGVGWIEIWPIYLIINVSEKLEENSWKGVLGEKPVAK